MKTRVFRTHLIKTLNYYNEILAQKFGPIARSEAIKELIEEGKLVYTYFGGSYIEVPHKEGAAND